MRIGYFLSSEEYDPTAAGRAGGARRAGRLRGALDQRPLPPMERRAGAEPVRLGRDRRDVAGLPAAGDDRCDRTDRAAAPGDRGAGGGHRCRAARGPLHPRRGHRGGAQRARARRPLAQRGRPPGDARGGRRADARAVAGRVHLPPRPPLHGRERTHLHPPRRRRHRSSSSAFGDEVVRPRAAHRRRIHHHPAGRGARTGVEGEGRGRQAGPGRLQGVRRSHRGRGCADRAPAVGQRRPAGRAVAGAAVAEALRAGQRAGHRGDDPRVHRLRQRRRGRHVEAFGPYAEAGFDDVYVANMGPHYREFFTLYGDEVLPRLRQTGARS